MKYWTKEVNVRNAYATFEHCEYCDADAVACKRRIVVVCLSFLSSVKQNHHAQQQRLSPASNINNNYIQRWNDRIYIRILFITTRSRRSMLIIVIILLNMNAIYDMKRISFVTTTTKPTLTHKYMLFIFQLKKLFFFSCFLYVLSCIKLLRSIV